MMRSLRHDALAPTRSCGRLDGAMPSQPAWQLLWTEKKVKHTARPLGSGLGRRVKDERAHRKNITPVRYALPLAD